MQEPQLEHAGAGLPFLHQVFLRFWVRPFVAAKSNWDADAKTFEVLNARTLEMVRAAPAEKLSVRVLVPPQRGLEDSSRFWSVAMTLDHMAIVGNGIAGLIVQLSRGTVPDQKVSIAAVKPSPDKPFAESLRAFEEFADKTPALLAQKVENRNSVATLDHPWFGPFTAHQWHWLLAAHQAIHLKQIREILKRA